MENEDTDFSLLRCLNQSPRGEMWTMCSVLQPDLVQWSIKENRWTPVKIFHMPKLKKDLLKRF